MKISICMGSACFARGNSENLKVAERYIKGHNISSRVEITGLRCSGCCGDGPHIIVNGRKYSRVTPDMMVKILEENANG